MASASRHRLDGSQTEESNSRSAHIDEVTTGELCRIINDEDATVADKVRGCIPIIAGAVDAFAECVRQGGRVIYVGAGTSGRLGVLDASEIPPTYSAPPGQFVGIIAGGDTAIRSSVEGAEDSSDAAVKDLLALRLEYRDCLVGIAASGRTPYVLSGLSYARSQGCVTVAIACASPSPMASAGDVDFMIEALTGPEVVTGSTRMKAGTATKMILNMLSTGIMIRNGKTYGNVMIDVKPSNAKLRQRARCMLRAICGAECPTDDEALSTVIDACNGSVKIAAVVLERDVPREEASRLLDQAGGILSRVIGPSKRVSPRPSVGSQSERRRYYLCVDGGGSVCEAAIYSGNELICTGKTGPCNITEVGAQIAAVEICSAVHEALKLGGLDPTDQVWKGFAGVWIAIAGGDRLGIRDSLTTALRGGIALEPEADLRITTDVELPAAVGFGGTDAENVLVLVAGTGSVAMAFERSGNGFGRIGRSGGWGPFLGDDGSGFCIGREALRYSLEDLEGFPSHSVDSRGRTESLSSKHLTRVILDFYQLTGCESSVALLDTLLLSGENKGPDATSTKKRIAGCAETVINASTHCDRAASIVQRAQDCLTELVRILLRRHNLSAGKSTLVLAGGLMQSENFCRGLRQRMESSAILFRDVLVSRVPACDGAQYLAKQVDRP